METASAYSEFKTIFDKAALGKTPAQTFEDFLDITFSAFTKKPNTGLTYYPEEFLRITENYRQSGTFNELMKLPMLLFRHLYILRNNQDLLGDFYMREIDRSSNCRYLLPFGLCLGMTQIFASEATVPCCVLDTEAGSGRLLLAFAKNSEVKHRYYGIEADPICAKMTALNLFMHDLPGEVILADNFEPDNFRAGYRINFAPAGIFRVPVKEQSHVWHMHRSVLKYKREDKALPQKRLLFF